MLRVQCFPFDCSNVLLFFYSIVLFFCSRVQLLRVQLFKCSIVHLFNCSFFHSKVQLLRVQLLRVRLFKCSIVHLFNCLNAVLSKFKFPNCLIFKLSHFQIPFSNQPLRGLKKPLEGLIFKLSNYLIFKFPHPQISTSPHPQILKSPHFQILKLKQAQIKTSKPTENIIYKH